MSVWARAMLAPIALLCLLSRPARSLRDDDTEDALAVADGVAARSADLSPAAGDALYQVVEKGPEQVEAFGSGCPECFSQMGYDVDMRGQKRTKEKSKWECMQRCRLTLGCAHFMFYPDGGCHLQAASAQATAAGDYVSAPSDCRSLQADRTNMNVHYHGVDFGVQKNVRRHEDCLAFCRMIRGCTYYTWYPAHGVCHGVRGRRSVHALPYPGAVSGPMKGLQCNSAFKEYKPAMPGQARSVERTQRCCQERCYRIPTCAFWTYWQDGGCHLHEADAQLLGYSGKLAVVSGPRECPPSTPQSAEPH